MKAIVDTNVILDVLTGRQPWNESAEKIFLLAAKGQGRYYITANVVTDIYYLVHKYYKDRTVEQSIMRKLLQLFSIYDTKAEDCINALHSKEMKDYEDAILVEVAKRNQVDYIITRNVRDFKDKSIKAIDPQEFLEKQNVINELSGMEKRLLEGAEATLDDCEEFKW